MGHHPAKRSACDRCRKHKLRCPRMDQSSTPCSRCARVGAHCVTGAAKPMGRPRVSSALTSPKDSGGRSQRSHGQSPRSSVPGPALSTSSGDNIMEMTDNTLGFMDFETELAQPASPGLFTEIHFGDAASGTLTNRLPDPLLSTQMAAWNGDLSISEAYLSHLEDITLDRHFSALDPDMPDVLISLSLLNGKLTRQLSMAATFPWVTPATYHNCLQELDTFTANPMEEALESANDLRKLLAELASRDGHKPSSSAITSAAPGQPKLSLPAALLLLSSYMQLMQLWNSMISRANGVLAQIPLDTIRHYMVPAGLHGLTMTKMEGALYVKIVLQIIEHNLHSVEDLLGLPSELRLSPGRKSHAGGLFSGPATSELLAATLAKTPHIRSLSENLDKMKQWVN